MPGFIFQFCEVLNQLVVNNSDQNSNTSVVRRELYGVRQEVIENLKVSLLVTPDIVEKIHVVRLLDLCAKLDLLQIRLAFDYVQCFEYHHRQIKIFLVQSKCIIVDLRLVQHVVYETLHHLLGVLLLAKNIQSIIRLLLKFGKCVSRVLIMKFSHVPNHLIAIFHFLKFYFEVSYTFYSFENLHFASVIPVILVLESSQLKVFHLLLLNQFLQLFYSILVIFSLCCFADSVLFDMTSFREYLVHKSTDF